MKKLITILIASLLASSIALVMRFCSSNPTDSESASPSTVLLRIDRPPQVRRSADDRTVATGHHQAMRRLVTADAVDSGYPAASNYPSTSQEHIDPAAVSRTAYHASLESRDRLRAAEAVAVAYENTIAPDEDLLQPLFGDGQSSRMGVAPQTMTQPSVSPSGRIPSPSMPLATPADRQPPSLAVPVRVPDLSATTSVQPRSTTPAIRPTVSGVTEVWTNQGALPDEDLLINLPPGSTERAPLFGEPSRGLSIPSESTPRIQADDPSVNSQLPAPQLPAPQLPPIEQIPSPSRPSGEDRGTPSWSKASLPQADEDLLINAPGGVAGPSMNHGPSGPAGPLNGQQIPRIAPQPRASSPLNPHGTASKPTATPGVDPHAEVFGESLFPSAKNCRVCHEQLYDEWASSSHAYAAVSPMFQKFEQTIHGLTQGTISYFCYRCHAPVAVTLGFPREKPLWECVPSAIEGVTCVACHRVDENYGKVNGERRLIPGDIHDPVYGAGYGEGLREVLANKNRYKVKPQAGEKGPGQNIHANVIHFEQLSNSSFCVSCHQVAVVPGISLEVVWAQYRASPACKQGIQCQDCHMGREPGVAAGYETGPVAVVNDIEVSPDRKHSNHMFYGPGYSIAHPGVFPFNPKADDWTIPEWIQFDYRSGWGTDRFEKLVDEGKIKVAFPKIWEEADDRMDAREIVDANMEKLEAKRRMRHRLMENGSSVEGPIFAHPPRVGRPLKFHYNITNDNLGHNMPSGSLGAQPQVWFNVALTGPGGQRLWESGYVDANGDIADVHSLEVAAGRIPRDLQLFNLQTKFLITGVKGTDREMALPINVDFDQLPFIRQSGFPVAVMNHPPFIRMESHSLPPLGTRAAKYRVPARLLQTPGVYRLSIRMRSRAEPIYFMRLCNATKEMERNMNYWMLDFHEESFQFVVQ